MLEPSINVNWLLAVVACNLLLAWVGTNSPNLHKMLTVAVAESIKSLRVDSICGNNVVGINMGLVWIDDGFSGQGTGVKVGVNGWHGLTILWMAYWILTMWHGLTILRVAYWILTMWHGLAMLRVAYWILTMLRVAWCWVAWFTMLLWMVLPIHINSLPWFSTVKAKVNLAWLAMLKALLNNKIYTADIAI
jgi:hypothetical protein